MNFLPMSKTSESQVLSFMNLFLQKQKQLLGVKVIVQKLLHQDTLKNLYTYLKRNSQKVIAESGNITIALEKIGFKLNTNPASFS